MARGLHRYAEMELRYGSMSGKAFRPFRPIWSSGEVSLPRGDFRISVVGAGGGGSFTKSINSSTPSTNTSGYFKGSFGVACGGRGGIIVFDVHVPHSGIVAKCTIGAGGKGRNASAAAAGGLSKIVISDLSISAQANGGAAGSPSTTVGNCKPGAGGTTSYSGITPVLNISKASTAVEAYNASSPTNYLNGRNFASKLDFSNSLGIDRVCALFADTEDIYNQLKEVSPSADANILSYYGNGGQGELSVSYNPDTEKYSVTGYEVDGWIYTGETLSGDDGVILIERL